MSFCQGRPVVVVFAVHPSVVTNHECDQIQIRGWSSCCGPVTTLCQLEGNQLLPHVCMCCMVADTSSTPYPHMSWSAFVPWSVYHGGCRPCKADWAQHLDCSISTLHDAVMAHIRVIHEARSPLTVVTACHVFLVVQILTLPVAQQTEAIQTNTHPRHPWRNV